MLLCCAARSNGPNPEENMKTHSIGHDFDVPPWNGAKQTLQNSPCMCVYVGLCAWAVQSRSSLQQHKEHVQQAHQHSDWEWAVPSNEVHPSCFWQQPSNSHPIRSMPFESINFVPFGLHPYSCPRLPTDAGSLIGVYRHQLTTVAVSLAPSPSLAVRPETIECTHEIINPPFFRCRHQ